MERSGSPVLPTGSQSGRASTSQQPGDPPRARSRDQRCRSPQRSPSRFSRRSRRGSRERSRERYQSRDQQRRASHYRSRSRSQLRRRRSRSRTACLRDERRSRSRGISDQRRHSSRRSPNRLHDCSRVERCRCETHPPQSSSEQRTTSGSEDKTQMSGDRAGSQCGLTSLLPMSCRGRAAAFARDLHSRLRNLGAAQDDECENSWLARDHAHRPTTSTQRDLETFYDFELECESPSSPVDEFDAPFPERSPTDEQEPPFYDVDSEPETKDQTKLMLQQPEKPKNGFKFSTAFFTECTPVKLQPAPRENGHADKPLYSPITFEGCARQKSFDEVDNVSIPSALRDTDRLSLPLNHSSTLDSDSEFESTKSDPSDCVDEAVEIENHLDNDVSECVENLSLTEVEIPVEEDLPIESTEKPSSECNGEIKEPLEIVTSEVPADKEVSPAPEIEPLLLSAEVKEENDEEDDRPQRVRRCSSLKTGKTPPGTPGRKKIVQFADVLGLDLADVKTFMDEIPVIPKSAYDDLTGCDVQSSPPVRNTPRQGALTLVPLFQIPVDVTEKLEKLNVCLESARVCDGVHVTICGSVRVRNLDFHKTVHIRYTMNHWKTYTDLQTTYVQGSCDGYSDRFQFVLYAPCISSGQRLELAVRFQCKGQQFWDSNSGANYSFDCLALGANGQQAPSPPGPLHPTVDWHPSFY